MSSVSRSKVRRCALSYVYSLLSQGGEGVDEALFWSIAQEKEMERCHTDHAKAVLHACRASEDSIRLLEERAEAALASMQGDLTTLPLREEMERCFKQHSAFESARRALLYSLSDKRRETTEQLCLCTEDVLRLARVVQRMTEDLIPLFEDYPAYRRQTQPLAAVLRRRCRFLSDCAELADPAALEGNSAYAGLVRRMRDIQEMRPAVVHLVQGVREHMPAFEQKIAELLQNYSVERLDVVDKAILYVSLYELLVENLDTPIVVSEATALAHEFSGSRSARFVHGIIAAAAQQKG